jgi:TonB family protein
VKRSTLFFFFGLVVVVGVIARCNSRSRLAQEQEQAAQQVSPLVPSAAPSPSLSATPSPQPTATPKVDVAKVASRIQPAVVAISVFDPAGKLLRTGTGVFVSKDGMVLTTRSLMEGGAHAIAKTSDNHILNINGILTDVQPDDLAVLDAEVKQDVPTITPAADPADAEGSPVAVVQSPLGRHNASILEGTITKKHKEVPADWLELSVPITADSFGSPVVNSRNEVIGLVTRGVGDPAVVVRTSPTLEAVLARTPESGKAKFLVEEKPVSPAEGPLVSPADGTLQKVPLAQNPQGRQGKLIYSPAPAYPNSAGMANGAGRFRLTFGANGQVKNIVILRSTRNGVLDQAAVDALRRWKSAPGEEWELNVPITFQ